MMLELNQIYNEDCLGERGMCLIPDKSVDMILCDLPYGTTACAWDSILPFDKLWAQYKRVIKDNGAIVLTASQPFTSALVMSNPKWFRYEWIWEKTIATNFMFVKNQPAKKHENVLVFYKHQPLYDPQMQSGSPYVDKERSRTEGYYNGRETTKKTITNSGTRYPSSVQRFSNGNYGTTHPTQKPTSLFEYLIRTYTKEDDIVMDNCMGSGTTAAACLSTRRNFIGFELDADYHRIANERISNVQSALFV